MSKLSELFKKMFSVSQEKIENINETNYARMGQKTIFIPDYLSEKLHKILSAENMNYLSVDRDDGKDSVAFIFESKKEADRAISFINILENEIEGNYRQHTVEIPKGMRMQVQDLLPSKLGYSIFESLDNPDKLDLMFSLKEDAEYFTSFVKKGKLENITEDELAFPSLEKNRSQQTNTTSFSFASKDKYISPAPKGINTYSLDEKIEHCSKIAVEQNDTYISLRSKKFDTLQI